MKILLGSFVEKKQGLSWADAGGLTRGWAGPGRTARPINTLHDGPRPGPARQIFRGLAATRPGPSKFSEDGLRPGPAHHISKKSRPGPARSIICSEVSARSGPVHHFSEVSARPGPARPIDTQEGERRCNFRSEDVPYLGLLHEVAPAIPSAGRTRARASCCLRRRDGKDCRLCAHNGAKALIRHLHKAS